LQLGISGERWISLVESDQTLPASVIFERSEMFLIFAWRRRNYNQRFFASVGMTIRSFVFSDLTLQPAQPH
jgi:hypothetical protein